MTTYTGQTALAGQALVSASPVNESVLVAALSGFGNVRSVLHKPDETNSIGLVMMAGVSFVDSRGIIPSGTNREYGYWRGSDNKDILNKFDKMWVPLEGTGVNAAGYPKILQVTPSVSASDSSGTCAADNALYTWSGSPGVPDGYWLLEEECSVFGCDVGLAPTEDGLFDGQQAYVPCTGTPAGSSDTYSTEESESVGVGPSIGSARWVKAGELKDQLGAEAVTQRCLQLSNRAYFNMGSGVNLGSSLGYSVYAKIVPSGDITNSVIIAQHKENPAQFVLGCDPDGLYYVRSDRSVSGVSVPVYAKTNKTFEEYKYPAHVLGVYASGDSTLKIYVNGKKEGQSESFVRDKKRSANSNVILGKQDFAISERGFSGWVDEVGISSESFEPETVEKLNNGTFKLRDYLFNTKVTPTGISGFSGESFGDIGIDAQNTSYAEFIVESGVTSRWNPTGEIGGSFDTDLWGQTNFGVSSVLTFDLMEMPARLHQITDLSLDMWIEHISGHASGADVTARLIHKDRRSGRSNLNWDSGYHYVPSGDLQLISLSGAIGYDAYYEGGDKSFKQDLEDHQLEIAVHYRGNSNSFNSQFKIYSTKMSFDGFDSHAKYNTKDGLTEASTVRGHSLFDIDGNITGYASGDRSLTLYSAGTSPVLSSGTMNLFVDTDVADQVLNLVINQDPVTSMGDTGYGFLSANAAIAMSGRQMNLYTSGGEITSDLVLFMKSDEALFAASPTLPLSVAGSTLSFPRDEKSMSLFFLADSGTGTPSGIMNLAMPTTHAPPLSATQILYVEGKKPIAEIPLYLKVGESSTKTIPLYVLAPSVYEGSGNMNMFIKQKDFYGTSTISALPAIIGTGNVPLFMRGYGVAGLATGTQATGTVSITDFTELNSTDKVNLIATDGTNYDFTNGDHSSVAGTWESATSNEVTATSLMNVINTSSGPAGTRFSASVVGAVVTITQNTSGPDGNTVITLTDAGSAGMTKTDFAGGLEPTRTMNLVMPEIFGSGTNTTTLNIRGYN